MYPLQSFNSCSNMNAIHTSIYLTSVQNLLWKLKSAICESMMNCMRCSLNKFKQSLEKSYRGKIQQVAELLVCFHCSHSLLLLFTWAFQSQQATTSKGKERVSLFCLFVRWLTVLTTGAFCNISNPKMEAKWSNYKNVTYMNIVTRQTYLLLITLSSDFQEIWSFSSFTCINTVSFSPCHSSLLMVRMTCYSPIKKLRHTDTKKNVRILNEM